MAYRVALGGFLHETNTFGPSKAEYADFVQGGGYMPLARGPALLENCRGINLGISGAVDHGQEAGWDMAPLLWTGAIPSAHVTREAFERISGEIIERLREAGTLDGVFLDLHGAMVCEHLDDGEGELLSRVRDVVGPDVPIAASLDLHGNITARMVELADILVGFRTYPHVDMAETGSRAAQALTRMMQSRRPIAKAYRRLPYLVPISWQSTDLEPGAGLYRLVAELERDDVVSTSLFMGFPAADFPDCGPVAIAYAGTADAAQTAVERVVRAYEQAEGAFVGPVYDAESGVAEAMRLVREGVSGPVVLADTQDNPGAGGDSNTTGMLRALVAVGAEEAAIGLMVDPHAAAQAHQAGEGAEIFLSLGGQSGVPDDAPYTLRVTVETLADGKLTAPGPFYGGARLDLGPSACLRVGGVRIVVTSRKAQMADREMFRFVGISPEEASLLVVKSSTHFRADFAPIASAILICTAPGPMAFSPADLPWRRLAPGMRLFPLGETYGTQ
ncbi:M81 family metallopeptidase [Billgrantia endophytica]|uniref:Microcystinase C n=1 Tax=Billgrantia endophytica TaxID=2033802 RepID=A0A2N7U5M3_9GAMM|nr:M81 family metallopeptidase [Halomonas endophytica]PMR75738.1 microcystin degradation protein MlrC [Halomonas endophytica]